MNGYERFRAVLAGRTDELAAGVAYPEVPCRDRSWEHTKAPWWFMEEADPKTCLPIMRAYLERVGGDWWNVLWTPPRTEREHLRYLQEDGRDFILDTRTGTKRTRSPPWEPQAAPSEDTRSRPSLTDEEHLARLEVVAAEKQIADGWWDFARATAAALGREYFLYSYGSIPFAVSFAKGFAETMDRLATAPAFLHRMGERHVAHQKEYFQAMARVGIHGVWLQDFYAGADMISRRHYQEIVRPHGRDLIAEAHRAGLVVIHYFMGNAEDRADLVADLGADILLFEEGRKGYGADLETLVARIRREEVVLMGNLPSESVLESADDGKLVQEIERLVQFGKRRGRFIFSTGSPPTPQTPLDRIRFAIETARTNWRKSFL